MKNSLLIFATHLILTQAVTAQNITFEDALKAKAIRYEVKSETGLRRLFLKIKNHKKNKIQVAVESGRFFIEESGRYQPFVVARPVAIRLAPGEEREVWLEGYCGNSSASSPKNNLTFKQTKMGSPLLCEVLQHMNDEKIVSKSLYQKVIWHFTNNHQLASLHAQDLDSITLKKTIQFVCEKEKSSPSWYAIEYAAPESGDELEFSGIPIHAKGTLSFYNPKRETISVELANESGETMRVIQVHLGQPQGYANLPMDLNLSKIPKGKYQVRVVNTEGKSLKEWPLSAS